MLQPSPEVRERLLHAPWARTLDDRQRRRVERDTDIARYGTGAVICREGEPARHWVGVLEGLAKVDTMAPDGRGTTFAAVASGGWVGEGTLLKRQARPYEVVALADSWVALMPSSTFEWLFETSLAFNHFLVRQLNERLGQFIELVQTCRMHGATTQVAVCLTALFNPALSPGAHKVLHLSQEEIARLCGLSRQVAARALHELAEAGVLEMHYGTLTVPDVDALSALVRGGAGRDHPSVRH